MRSIISICLLWLCQLALFGQTGHSSGDGYDPTNPQDPDAHYILQLAASPQAGGTVTFQKQYVKGGDNIYLSAQPNQGYRFVKWQKDNEVISTNKWFTFTMPQAQTKLTAVFEYLKNSDYDPSNPQDPDATGPKHVLKLSCMPDNAGGFNAGNTINLVEGDSIFIYPYPNSNFTFKGWQIGGKTISTSTPYKFVMGKNDINLIGTFSYTPGNPSNPGANSWNETTGELIIDDFTPGNIMSAIDQATGGNRNKVLKVTVSGVMNYYDFSLANYLPSCAVLDLSRVIGITELPSYAFDGTNLQSVILPSTIEKIGYAAFAGCQSLTSVSCYAVTPPSFGGNVFESVPDGLVIHVLSSSVSLYAATEGWKNYTLLAMTEDVRNLEVALPEGSADGRYKNMLLELVNIKTAQKQKYVITDRTTYTFNGLLKQTLYNVYLKNQTGAILGELDSIAIKTENVKTAFTKVLTPRTVTLKVMAKASVNVTEQAQIGWTDRNGNYLAQGNSISGLTAGTVVKYDVSLPQTLGMQYLLPQQQSYTVIDGDNNPVLTLVPIDTLTVTGTVRDIKGGALSGATISVSQRLNGRYSKSFVGKTDNKGFFRINVFDDQSTISVSATDYISKTWTKDKLSDAKDWGTISLKSITGATLTTNYTYRESVVPDSTAIPQNWYQDYANVSFSIYNETQQRAITQFNVQYPSIILLEEVKEKDVLRLTATSKTSAFRPVEAKAKIDSLNRASFTLPIVALGGIKASFKQTDNASVVGILYNASGELAKKYTYSNASLSISDLQDGEYTLVSMASSTLFNSILRLNQLEASGLKEGTDYIKNTVTIKSGVLSVVSNDLIPKLDETKLYYTSDATLFSVNKTSIVAGNYLTLRGKLAFKSAFAGQIGDVKMIVDLPSSASFVENSVMAGNKIAAYTLEGSRLTVPLTNYSDEVRFCVIPQQGGEYNPNAFTEFSIGGKEIQQPIGSVFYTVKDLSISIPSIVAKTSVPISGTAQPNSDIEIFDNGTMIGQTTALANGQWITTCELHEPYNMSSHSIYAKVTTKQGLALQSETQDVMYNQSAISATDVTMIFYNGYMRRNVEVFFDMVNAKTTPSSYAYYQPTDFTFIVNLTNNSPDQVLNVVVNVFTTKNEIKQLSATYDQKKNRWIATSYFDYNGMPTNVSVSLEGSNPILADAKQIEDGKKYIENISREYTEGIKAIEACFADTANLSEDKIKEMASKIGIDYFEANNDTTGLNMPRDFDSWTNAQKENFLEKNFSTIKQETDSLLNCLNGKWNSFFNLKKEYQQTFDNGSQYKQTSCDGLTPDSLVRLGFEKVQLTDSSYVYYFSSTDSIAYADFNHNVYFRILMSQSGSPNSKGLKNSFDKKAWSKMIKDMLQHVKDVEKWINDKQDLIIAISTKPIKEINDIIDFLKVRLSNARNYYNMSTVSEVKRARWKKEVEDIEEAICEAEHARKELKPLLDKLIKITDVVNAIKSLFSLCNAINEVDVLYYRITPCEDDEERAQNCRVALGGYLASEVAKNVTDIAGAFSSKSEIVSGAILALPTAGASLAAVGWGIVQSASIEVLKFFWDKLNKNALEKIKEEIRKLHCYLPPPPDNNHNTPKPPTPPTNPIHDPSGYVYEGVESNRVEGVTATCYYKETYEDMYGDKHDRVVLWNAADYAQENPLFTDENGMYRWDVPQGMWQVKFEKEGYQTTYSEWLPVPPPQLDVNIAITQDVQPSVKTARAYEDGIEVDFDKYMQPSTLNTDNVYVTKNGKIITGTVTLLNEEKTTKNALTTFVSKVRFVPTVPFLTTDEVLLTISRKVKSYAGIQMEADYTQKFDIVKEVKKIVADSLVKVTYNGDRKVTVSVLPYDAGIGKKITAKSSSPLISTVTAEATLDNQGQAEFTITGELPGNAVIEYAVEDASKTSSSIVNVVEEIPETMAPKASRASGTAVYRNTTVTLTSDTKGATIYYTTDGSCPCDENGTRKIYSAPLNISSDIIIKAMAVAKNATESQVSSFSYTIKTTSVGMNLKQGWNWISHNLESDVDPIVIANADVLRFVGQTSELVRDPKLGLTGNLKKADVVSSYKLQMAADSNYVLSGFERNTSLAPISLKTGWNWIGYPVNQTLSLAEAFANLTPQSGDYIVGQDGFAEYANGIWTGTLKTLVPGKGYLYQSQSAKSFIYNAQIVSKSHSLYPAFIYESSPWAADKYKYPNVMCVVADLYDGTQSVTASEYTVGAFCGTECRGVAQDVNGHLLISVYGEGNEKISFRAVRHANGKTYDITETTPFNQTKLGGVIAPYLLHLGSSITSASSVSNRWYATITRSGLLVIKGLEGIERVSLTSMNGAKVFSSEWSEGQGSVSVSHLADEVYILTITTKGDTYYNKLMKNSH